MVPSELTVGCLLLVVGVATFAGGVALRSVVGHRRQQWIGRVVRTLRESAIGGVLYGPVAADALDDEELDQTILMPTIVLGCGFLLTGVFLLGYAIVS